MGAKQSKRSVDISGKEAEGGGEVAAAGAGGEGRMEQLADADALKPQLNGDAHIQHEQTEKEKELDSGTPENEKDATTEKEGKEEDNKDKETVPVTNGETEQKVENGESAPAPEDGKKPKKEKVKKKWSLRSISFSRKDKPKQEKKQKEEEPKTNGEPEKVPEETAETSPEPAANEAVEEAKVVIEEKDEKTPETPVTEPLTNGTSSPECIKAETPASEEAAPAPSPAAERSAEGTPEPDQVPINGLSLEEPKPETPEVDKTEETKPEPPAAETVEIVPAPEIPKEVCVEQMPLLEPTPPPLPANPPPSSVASFAATTMAPELTDASLANTADAAIAPLSALSDTKDNIIDTHSEPPTVMTDTQTLVKESPSPLKEIIEDTSTDAANDNALEATVVNEPAHINETPLTKEISEITEVITEAPGTVSEPETVTVTAEAHAAASEHTTITETPETVIDLTQTAIPEVETVKSELIKTENVENGTSETDHVTKDTSEVEIVEIITTEIDNVQTETETRTEEPLTFDSMAESDPLDIPIPEDISEIIEDSSLPPPPAQDEADVMTNLGEVDDCLKQLPEPIAETEETIVDSNHISNGLHDAVDVDVELAAKGPAAARDARRSPLTEDAPHTPQEPLPVSDKLADLIPDIPDVPQLNTETLQETATDVAVAN